MSRLFRLFRHWRQLKLLAYPAKCVIKAISRIVLRKGFAALAALRRGALRDFSQFVPIAFADEEELVKEVDRVNNLFTNRMESAVLRSWNTISRYRN